jgi:hypothetical protein
MSAVIMSDKDRKVLMGCPTAELKKVLELAEGALDGTGPKTVEMAVAMLGQKGRIRTEDECRNMIQTIVDEIRRILVGRGCK